MALETGEYISDLVITNPPDSDPKAQGAGHLRLTKKAVKQSFPGITGAVTATHTELNYVAGVTSALQTQLAAKAPLASPALTGNPTAPTQATGDRSTKLATTAFVAATSLAATLPGESGATDKLPLVSNGSPASAAFQALSLAAADAAVTGVLAVANGGSGQSSYTDGQLLIGNSTGNTQTKATLTAGSGISITNGSGSISIAATSSVTSTKIGMALSYSSTTVIGVAAGVMMDSTNAVKITGTAFTKSTAGTWAAGTAGNGMGTGLTIANTTWYHVFAIINAGAYDVYFDTSITAANKPASTTSFVRIGSFLTNGSAEIISFSQVGTTVWWTTGVSDATGAPPSSATLLALTVPSGIAVSPILYASYYNNSAGTNAQMWSPVNGATARDEFSLGSQVTGISATGNSSDLITNTSRQIYYKYAGGSGPDLTIKTLGWIDPSLAPV